MIGIFDSGVGGLTVLKALREIVPSADVIYFGDTTHAPYGEQSREAIAARTMHSIRFLHEQGATKIISACNSVSASLTLSLYDTLSIEPGHVIEMVGPTTRAVGGSTNTNRTLICATPATVASHIYQNAFHMIGASVDVVSVPGLAGAIENDAEDTTLRSLITQAFSEVSLEHYDMLILACTHYPLILPLFKELFPRLSLYDPAQAVAERAAELWERQEVGEGRTHFFVSKDTPVFRHTVATLFPDTDFSLKVVE
ncbi:MAG: glutamate racemase [Patescibacteria group bacterium UBA2163]